MCLRFTYFADTVSIYKFHCTYLLTYLLTVGIHGVVTGHQQAGQEWSQKNWEDLILKVRSSRQTDCYLFGHVSMYYVYMCDICVYMIHI